MLRTECDVQQNDVDENMIKCNAVRAAHVFSYFENDNKMKMAMFTKKLKTKIVEISWP